MNGFVRHFFMPEQVICLTKSKNLLSVRVHIIE